MQKFMDKYYKPWSLSWIIQQAVLVVREGRLGKVSFKTLRADYRSTREVDKALRSRAPGINQPGSSPGRMAGDAAQARQVTCPGLSVENLSLLNRFFDHVYVINLDRRNDRRESMIKKLESLHIRAEFFPAVDGAKKENLKEFEKYFNEPIDPGTAHEMEVKLKRKVIVSPGAWGILKTYRKLLSEARERGYGSILCLEDDVVFAKDFEKMFGQALKIMPENWKVLYLGASQHTWEEGADIITPEGVFSENSPVCYYLPLNTDGAFAVGLRADIIPFLLDESSAMNCPLDSGALRSAARRFKSECFVLLPNLVIADVSQSDIRTGRKQADFARIARWDLSLYDFNKK